MTPVLTSPDFEYTLEGVVGRIDFNRPNALNALSLYMMDGLAALIVDWEKNAQIKSVLVTGRGERAFCAGGDLRAVYMAQKDQDMDFLGHLFAREYAFNVYLHAFSKPYASLMQGYTMGGGVGASVHGSHRIVCETSVLSMPETGIGYFPDVGASYFLNRAPGAMGMYLGLTGVCFSPSDALYAGLATHFIPVKNFQDFKASFLEAQPETIAQVDDVLAPFLEKAPPSTLEMHQELIDECFGRASVAGIFEALSRACDPFAQETLNLLKKRSPMSLLVTFEHLKRTPHLSFPEAMAQEYRLSQHFVRDHDFHEGIRAAVIDKDRNPRWEHVHIEEINLERVASYFNEKPLTEDLPL